MTDVVTAPTGSLFPVWTMPSTVAQAAASQPPPAYLPSPAFDFSVYDFVVDANGHLLMLDGWSAWAQWCVKAVITQRNSYAAYDQNYGTDLDLIEQANSQAATEQNATNAITRALMADPRTGSVSDFAFTWAGSALSVSLTVTPTVGTSQQITVALSPPFS